MTPRSTIESDNPLVLAHELSDQLFSAVQKDSALGGQEVADRLRELRNAIWPMDRRLMDAASKKRAFHDAFAGLDGEKKDRFLEAYAHMGQLYEIAGLAARHNFFKRQPAIPAGVRAFVDDPSLTDADTAVAKLNQPEFEVTMTMHPTNTHSLESMRAQRNLSKALEQADEEKVARAVLQFAHVPVLHQQEGADANFTVRDETAVVVNYLDNIYEDTSAIYGQLDRNLKRKFEAAYKPEELDLKIRLGSWGSAGDKDGNHNVTAETTLEAIVMHMQAVISRYRGDLTEIKDTTLAGWKDKLKQAKELLEGDLLGEVSRLRQDSNEARRGHNHIPAREIAERFDALESRVSDLYRSLDAGEFKQALLDSYKRTKDDRTLELLRKVRLFGFEYAKIEYRETAEEYERVIAALVPGYSDMRPEDKVRRLTAILQNGNEANQLFQQHVDHIIEEGATHSYSDTSPLPIAYHTMKRMDLARDFPNFIRDNVLAECGRMGDGEHSADEISAQGAAHILEAQFMQRMMPEKDGRRPVMGIIPLFEEPGTMMNIDHIMRQAYENPAYQQHMQELAVRRHQPVTQQVQIAHSDNARRSGLLAARAYIHEAHKKIRILNDEKGIRTQFFEGGSISDAYRNGVRAVSASVNAFDLHDFAKFTFQGGDLVNYFSAPSSTARLFTRNITHMASRFEMQDGQWHVRKRSPMKADDDPNERNNKRRPNPVMEDVAVAALQKTLADYQREDFRQDTMGTILAVLDYEGEKNAGTRGSRAAQRGNKKDKAAPVEKSLEQVNIEKVRTIGFSEAWQHAGIVPSWIGSRHLATHLLHEVLTKKAELQQKTGLTDAEQQFMTEFSGVTERSERLLPKQVNMLYDKSPTFRDAQDRAVFGLAMTDPEAIDWLDRQLNKLDVAHPGDPKILAGKKYVTHIRETYDLAAELAHEALKGKFLEDRPVQPQMVSILEPLRYDMQNKSQYRDFLLYVKLRGLSEHQPDLTDHQRGVLHNAGDTVVHGRFLAADDPAYGKARLEREELLAR